HWRDRKAIHFVGRQLSRQRRATRDGNGGGCDRQCNILHSSFSWGKDSKSSLHLICCNAVCIAASQYHATCMGCASGGGVARSAAAARGRWVFQPLNKDERLCEQDCLQRERRTAPCAESVHRPNRARMN